MGDIRTDSEGFDGGSSGLVIGFVDELLEEEARRCAVGLKYKS
jgi:hypothetical protein